MSAPSANGASSSTPPPADSGAFERIPLDLLDEPANPERETMDDVRLAKLAENIARCGLIEPLVVEPAGDRFRVVAGHRRLIACQMAKYSPVPCLVRAPGEVDPVAITLAENYHQERVNPAEEAAFIDRVYRERCNEDIELTAALFQHTVAWVDDRLLLLRGDPQVLEALRRRDISLPVARELNKVKNPQNRIVYLDAAIKNGATGQVVRNWRQVDAAADQPLSEERRAELAAIGAQANGTENPMRCMFCGDTDEPYSMVMVWLHKKCKQFVDKMLEGSGVAPQKES